MLATTVYKAYTPCMAADYSKYLDLAKDLALQGGKIAKLAQEAGEIPKSIKTDTLAHVVTKYDTEIENLYVDAITKAFPTHRIYGEETGDHAGKSDFEWLIDPIDGTSNFAYGLPTFATMLALLHNDEVVAATIYIPKMGELLYAQKGGGAFLNGRKLSVCKMKTPAEAFIFLDRGGKKYDDWYMSFIKNNQSKIRGTRILGSCGVQMAYVAAGRMDAFVSKGTKRYDRAPGVLFIQEAGGKLARFDGTPFQLGDEDLIAANPSLVDAIVEELKL